MHIPLHTHTSVEFQKRPSSALCLCTWGSKCSCRLCISQASPADDWSCTPFILVSELGVESLSVFKSSLPSPAPTQSKKLPSSSSSLWVDLSGLHLALSSEVFSASGMGCWCFWKEFAAFMWCSLQTSNHCLVAVHVPILLPWVCPSTQASVDRCRKALFDVSPHKKVKYIKKYFFAAAAVGQIDKMVLGN